MLLLAVPGSGKTTVLVTRIGYMVLCLGINPADILVLTYTVAAAQDMKERFASIFGEELAGKIEFRTINGICAKIIAWYGYKIGKPSFELISDEKQASAIISEIYREKYNDYPTESDIKGIRTGITYIKNMMLKDEEIADFEKNSDVPFADIYSSYLKILRERRLMDYDDQLVYAYRLLNADSELLQHFQGIYKYICVDEAQDTSKIQHEIIALLAKPEDNLFMVGDEDQSIYGFRAAYPDALLDFEKNHSGAKVLLMEENFRSNAKIVDLAGKFIKKNTMRHDKGMHPAREPGCDIREIPVKNPAAQYSYILKVAKDTAEQTAVLYRDNESVIPLADLFERNSVSYSVKGADYTFFTYRSVTDIKNIIKFAYNPYDEALFMQIYYKLDFYLNKQNAEKACSISHEKNISILDAAQLLDIKGYTKGEIKKIQTHLRNMKEENAGKALYRIIDCCGYDKYMQRAGINPRKTEILRVLASREQSPKSFLDRLDYLDRLLKNKSKDSGSRLILSTIHSSKGLEYDNVYLMDVMDGVFPGNTPDRDASKEEKAFYEEERRLFYVGITRAKEKLCIFSINNESSFADQLFGRVKSASQVRKDFVTVNHTAVSSDAKRLAGKLKRGTKVTHQKFGLGTVISADENVVSIKFSKEIKTFSTEIISRMQLIDII